MCKVLMVDSLDSLSLVRMVRQDSYVRSILHVLTLSVTYMVMAQVALLDGVPNKCLELSPALESSKWSRPSGPCLKLCLTFRHRALSRHVRQQFMHLFQQRSRSVQTFMWQEDLEGVAKFVTRALESYITLPGAERPWLDMGHSLYCRPLQP
eukprot:jgi/Botrbrau1/21408/Bobra.0216s0027.1